VGRGIFMSELVNSIMASAESLSAPTGSVAAPTETGIHPATDTAVPTVADFLEVSAFFSPNAIDYSPAMVHEIRNMVRGIQEHINNQYDGKANEDQIRDFLAQMITENKYDKLSPTDKLEKIYLNIDLIKRMDEVKKLKEKINA